MLGFVKIAVGTFSIVCQLRQSGLPVRFIRNSCRLIHTPSLQSDLFDEEAGRDLRMLATNTDRSSENDESKLSHFSPSSSAAISDIDTIPPDTPSGLLENSPIPAPGASTPLTGFVFPVGSKVLLEGERYIIESVRGHVKRSDGTLVAYRLIGEHSFTFVEKLGSPSALRFSDPEDNKARHDSYNAAQLAKETDSRHRLSFVPVYLFTGESSVLVGDFPRYS